MFAVVNTYTRASQSKGLFAENSYQMQPVVGNIFRDAELIRRIYPGARLGRLFRNMRDWGLI